MSSNSERLQSFMQGLERRNPGEAEFLQAVQEFAATIIPFIEENPQYRDANILERMTEPDRIIIFRVCWEDDQGNIRTNRAWRVQFNNAIGPYKGGLRFHPSVNMSILKFLGFEQTFKNSLTTLPMGGGKGGSNFNPKGKSDREVMRFCQAMMSELARHIGEHTDIPAGDIGVGAREISYLFGRYKQVEKRFAGTITVKGLSYGGSLGRTEATGYGCVYFAQEMLNHRGESLEGKVCMVSGSGNVALYTIEMALAFGAKVITASDSEGCIYDPHGFDEDKLAWLKDLKEVRRGRIREYAEHFNCEFYEGKRPWGLVADVAFPCATQNEISGEEARLLLDNGIKVVCEGANMPTELAAAEQFVEAGIMYGPAKAANAGGVAVSGLEQSQNALRLSWTREEVDERLREIMRKIHTQCVTWGSTQGRTQIDYVQGANIAGFIKVADAMLAYGCV